MTPQKLTRREQEMLCVFGSVPHEDRELMMELLRILVDDQNGTLTRARVDAWFTQAEGRLPPDRLAEIRQTLSSRTPQ